MTLCSLCFEPRYDRNHDRLHTYSELRQVLLQRANLPVLVHSNGVVYDIGVPDIPVRGRVYKNVDTYCHRT